MRRCKDRWAHRRERAQDRSQDRDRGTLGDKRYMAIVTVCKSSDAAGAEDPESEMTSHILDCIADVPRVLVADDDEDTRALVSAALGDEGYDVVTASTG